MRIILIIIFALLLSAAFAPIESLRWWAGWFGDKDIIEELKEFKSEKQIKEGKNKKCFILYLSGVGMINTRSIPEVEAPLISVLKKEFPNYTLIQSIFPYIIINERFKSLGKFLQENTIYQHIIALRNTFYVLISSDKRYGPIYNLGIAKKILYTLKENGYVFGSKTPIIIIGSSGGAQIAIGATTYLQKILKRDITIISLAGIFSDDPGFSYIKKFYHVYGAKDNFMKYSPILFPGRWPTFKNSYWNKARQNHIVEDVPIGPHRHFGKKSYFDQNANIDKNQTYFDKTVKIMISIIQNISNK